MNLFKKFLIIAIVAAFAVMTMGVVSKVKVKADSYTITFSTGSGDGTSASTSTSSSSIVSSGSSYLTGNLVTATKVYYNGDFGLKLGTSSAAGVIKMNLAESITPTSIVVRAKRYSSSKAATLSVNGSDAQDVGTTFGNLTFDITSRITYIQLNSSKYIWIESITINYPDESSIVSVSSVSLNKSSTSIAAGHSEQLTATVLPDNATTKDVSWSSSNESVAKVTDDGTITGVSAGDATITVTTVDGEKTATCSVTVTSKSSYLTSFEGLTTQASLKVAYSYGLPNVFTKVTDISDLHENDLIIIVAAEANYALGAVRESNFGSVSITKTLNTIEIANTRASVLTLVEGTVDDSWGFKLGDSYLYAASSSSNNLKLEDKLDDNGSFKITITDGEADIVAQGTNTRNVLRYNPNGGSPLFSCYQAGKQSAVSIYRFDSTDPNNYSDSYEFEQADLRFGLSSTIFTTAMYNDLINGESEFAFGIAVSAGSWNEEKALSNKKEITPVDNDGNKQFALVIEDVTDYDLDIYAKAFVRINDVYFWCGVVHYSVNSIATDYLTNHSTDPGVSPYIDMLTALASA